MIRITPMSRTLSPKLFIALTILLVVIILLGGFWYFEGKNLKWAEVVLKGRQNQTASSTEEVDEKTNKGILQPEVSTEGWQKYRNEEYGFEVKYPKGWYWEDYTEDFHYLKIGFYPPDKSKGWEYVGDIQIAVMINKENLNLY